MGFIIAKTFLYVIVPPSGLFIIIVAGFFISRRHPRLGKNLIIGGFVVLYLLSISPVSHALLKPLEMSAPPARTDGLQADAIVVLGAGARNLSWIAKPAEPLPGTLYRAIHGVVLYRKLHLPLVFAGGNGDPSRMVEPDADIMAATARSLGVPGRDVILENKSRSTIESAARLKSLISGRRIILVTSAYHIKRAAALFRKQGFEVIPDPADHLAEVVTVSVYSLIPSASSLSLSSTAFTEYASLLWYMLTGSV